MTRQDILAMPAGWKLDTLVAERCLNLQSDSDGVRYVSGEANGKAMYSMIDCYSTDLNAAWNALAEKYYMNIAIGIDAIVIQTYECNRDEDYKKVGSAVIGKLEETATLICKAALLAELGL